MVSSSNRDYTLNKNCFENLPDEILLLICRYLSPVHILDSFLNLNKRLNTTISLYREKFFLSHLSHNEFHHLINDYLPYLSSNVNHLYINNCSMINIGKIFEEKFNKIDQQFPNLRQLIFHQIDIETLENLSWRFNTMKSLEVLIIDITEDRLSSMPVQFDEFLCGKLFLISNTFKILKLNLNKYQFSLHSIRHKCLHIQQLTISVKRLSDLFILFDYFPNLEQLNITISCSSNYNLNNNSYSYDKLWWKVQYLTKFTFSIKEYLLTSHDDVIPNDIIMNIVKNLYSLEYFKFNFNIKFSSTLQSATTKEIYINKYFPYVNGTLWQQALERHHNRTVQFELFFDLDGIANYRSKRGADVDIVIVDKYNDIDFNPLLKSTYSSAYWLQKNISIKCFTTPSKHVLIYTLPITDPDLSTTIDIIDQQISVKSSSVHEYIQNLIIRSNSDCCSSKLSITNLFNNFPYLLYLKIDSILSLPPNISICSTRLRSLSISNCSLVSCCPLLDYLPCVRSLSLTNTRCIFINIDSYSKPLLSINRLKLSIGCVDINNLSNLTKYFPNLNEFNLIIKTSPNRSTEDFRDYEKLECFSEEFHHLRYIEISLPVKQDYISLPTWLKIFNSNQSTCTKSTDGNSLIFKTWL